MQARQAVKKNPIRLNQTNAGMTMVELLVASGLLVIIVTGLLLSYIRALELNEISRNSSIAVQAGRTRMDTIKNTTFAQVKTTYNNITFNIAGLNAKGISYVDDTNPELLKITIPITWKQKNGRLFGEDADLDGVLDGGEDKNANGLLSSPVEIVDYIFQR
jgi:Tfp pilus assembly protein PilV